MQDIDKKVVANWIMFIAFIILLCIGNWKCFEKLDKCSWPIGKAEIIYIGGVATGLSIIVGWIDIEDK